MRRSLKRHHAALPGSDFSRENEFVDIFERFISTFKDFSVFKWNNLLINAGICDVLTSSSSEFMESRENESPPSTPGPSEVINSIRERTIAENSMVVLLQGLQGQVTTVDLKNESTARGRVVNVDAFMNIRLEDVLYRDRRGQLTQLQDLFVTGRNIRYVHIPDHMDIMKTIQSQLAKIHRVRNFASHGGGRKEYAKKTK